MDKDIQTIVTVPGKRDHLGNFFKIELLLYTAGKSRL